MSTINPVASSSGSSPTRAHKRFKVDENQQKRERTFRVRGVPCGWGRDKLEDFLTRQSNAAGPAVRSLNNEIHGRSQTATVSFSKVPEQLQAFPAERWNVAIPAPNDQFSGMQRLTLDDDFLGITTLHAPCPEDHKIEYVFHLVLY